VHGTPEIASAKPSRPGWAALALLGGMAIGIAGYLVARAGRSSRSACQIARFYYWSSRQLNSAFHATVYRVAARPPSCSSASLHYDLGIALTVLGAVLALIALITLLIRSRRATAAGTPWATQRAAASAARWLDAHLPGRRGPEPRIRPGFVTVLALVALVGAVVGADAAWRNYYNQQELSAQLRNYDRAAAALASVQLPATMHREPSANCGNPLCARSALPPRALQPFLRRFLHGAPEPGETAGDCQRLMALGIAGCAVTVNGEYDGYPTVGLVFPHMLIVRHGHPPQGAIRDVRNHEIFFLGSDIWIGPVLVEYEGN